MVPYRSKNCGIEPTLIHSQTHIKYTVSRSALKPWAFGRYRVHTGLCVYVCSVCCVVMHETIYVMGNDALGRILNTLCTHTHTRTQLLFYICCIDTFTLKHNCRKKKKLYMMKLMFALVLYHIVL